jgi:hypothetical protein
MQLLSGITQSSARVGDLGIGSEHDTVCAAQRENDGHLAMLPILPAGRRRFRPFGFSVVWLR